MDDLEIPVINVPWIKTKQNYSSLKNFPVNLIGNDP